MPAASQAKSRETVKQKSHESCLANISKGIVIMPVLY